MWQTILALLRSLVAFVRALLKPYGYLPQVRDTAPTIPEPDPEAPTVPKIVVATPAIPPPPMRPPMPTRPEVVYTKDLDDDFFLEGVKMASELGGRFVDFLKVMANESGVKAQARNPYDTSQPAVAVGLIQFTHAAMGGDLDYFRLHHNATEQLPFVKQYYRQMGGAPYDSVGRIYQTTFLPATLKLGSDPGLVLAARGGPYSWAYDANTGLDVDRNGEITVSDLEAVADRAAKGLGARWSELVLRATWAEETLGLGGVSGGTVAAIAGVGAVIAVGVALSYLKA